MGKGGGALSMWIKEFTALVFTQTIQAFIYAIIISIILFGMVQTSGISGDDNNAALGLMATFALLSVFKVEELAKKIFGIGDTKASHGNAMKSIAKTAFAVKLGKRVLDNGGKVLGGVRAITKSRQDNRKTKSRLEEDMMDNGFEMQNGKPVYVGTKKTRASSSGGGSPVSANPAVGNPSNTEVSDSGNGSGADVHSGDSNNSGNAAAAATAGNYEISDAAQRRMRNALRNYEDKMDDIKKARNEGIKNIAKGLAEFAAAPIGAAAGGLLGGADGNLDEMFQGMVAGAGVADAAAESVINTVDRATQFVQRNAKHKAGISNKELQRAINNYKTALQDATVNYGSASVDDIDI